jgi:hypothetical protein
MTQACLTIICKKKVCYGVLPELTEKIELELCLLNRVVEEHAEVIERLRASAPIRIEVMAMGAIVHSFYMGIERIFDLIAVSIDGKSKHGFKTHVFMLDSMMAANERRMAVISQNFYDTLIDYLNFRHLFRHAYDFTLKWERMDHLVFNMRLTLAQLELELASFINSLHSDRA